MSTQLVSCPDCHCDYGYIATPLSTDGIKKEEKHEELVTFGTLAYGDGPGKFNASFDHVGVDSRRRPPGIAHPSLASGVPLRSI